MYVVIFKMGKRKIEEQSVAGQQPVAKKAVIDRDVAKTSSVGKEDTKQKQNVKLKDSNDNQSTQIKANNKKLVTSILKQGARPDEGFESPKRRVSFPPPVELSDTLKSVSEGKEDMWKGGMDTIMGQLENLRGNSLVLWLQELQSHICVLGKQSSTSSSGLESLVVELLKLHWGDMEPDVVEAYKGFLVNLVSANTCYTRATVRALLDNFKPTFENKDRDSRVFRHTHEVLQRLLVVSPVGAREELLAQISYKFPFHKMPAYKQVCYVSALLQMTYYTEKSREQILATILEKMIRLDAHLSRETVEEFNRAKEEEEGEVDQELNNLVTALDLMVKLLVTYIDENILTEDKYDEDKARPLVDCLMKVFATHLLPTYNIVHTQFIFFHLASRDPTLCKRFMAENWRTFINPNTPSILRQTAMAYISSLLSRCSTVTPGLILAYLEKITAWAHSYVRARDDQVTGCLDFMYTDLACHGSFYSACQAVFYLFAFKHRALVTSPTRAKVLQGLSWHSLVTSHLNPLRVCLPGVVENFTRVARHYQLAYCTTIVERNNRINLPVVGSLSSSTTAAKPLLLDCFFPFDPYLLEDSRDLFESKYLQYVPSPAIKADKEAGNSDVEGENEEPLNDSVEESEWTRARRHRQDSVRSNASSRSRTDSVGCLTELLLQDLPGC